MSVSAGPKPGNHVVWMERKFDAYKLSRSMYPSIFNSFPVIRTASAKNRHFHVPQPAFFFPWRRPCDYNAICCMDGKTIQCLPNPRSTYLSVFNSFRVIRCLSQCVIPKIAIFYHILVSQGDAPGAITLNVIWMEREFDAYKLSRWMYPYLPITVSEIERYIGPKSSFFHTPLHSTPPLGGVPVGTSPPRLVWKY